MKQNPKILLIGKNGQVGSALLPRLKSSAGFTAVDRSQLDLTNASEIQSCMRSLRPDVVINAAAYTAVDKAESEPQLAHAVNATAPEVLARECAKLGALLVHYSTDYVFDGRKASPYVESDLIGPLNVYGRTKAEGEEAIRNSSAMHLIFRTSWVFSAGGSNFLLTMLRLGRERERLRIVDDQVGAPTSSESIAETTVRILAELTASHKAEESLGTYHLTAAGETSWFGFASEIFHEASEALVAKTPKLEPIPTSSYSTPAQRPLNSRLSCSKLTSQFNVTLPSWREGVSRTLESLAQSTFA